MSYYNPYQNYNFYQSQTPPQYNSYPQSTPQTNNNSGIIWVQGEAGAKSYLIAPNTTIDLWDSEDKIIYLKSADAAGIPSIKTLHYTIDDEYTKGHPDSSESRFATKDDISLINNRLDALEIKLGGLKDE